MFDACAGKSSLSCSICLSILADGGLDDYSGRVFVVEKMGLDVLTLVDIEEEVEE